MSHMRNPASFGMVLLVAAMAGACGGDAPRSGFGGDAGDPVRGGTVVIAEIADMTIPLSILAQTTMDGNLGGDVMYMELVRGAWEDGRLVFRTADENPMAIARSYELFGPDSSSIRFHMRSDVRWSDGTPLTAHDVVFTYDILDDPALASPLQHYAEHIRSVEAEDDSTVVFHFTRRNADMLTHSAVAVLPQHVFGNTPPGEIRNHPTILNPANGNLVVSGPYMVGDWQRGQRIVLVRNPHFEPAGYLDQIVFRIIPDPTTRLVELQTGGVDVLTALTLEQLAQIRAQAPHVRIEREEKRFYDYIAYNPSRVEAFADVDVRRALGLAIDVEGIIRALGMEEFAVPAGGHYSPIFEGLHDPEGQAPLPYDPEEAVRILAEKGWRDTNGDGVLDRNGSPLRFTLATNAGNQRRADVAQIVQEQWRRIGVDVRLQQLETNTLYANLGNGDYEAVLAGWSVALSPDLTAIWGAGSPFNFVNYEDPEVTGLIQQALAQPTFEAAAPLWREAASAITEAHPYTWLYFLDAVDGVNNRIRGTRIDTYGPYQNVWEWWAADATPAEDEATTGG